MKFKVLKKVSELPAEYQEVEYIEGTGTQYIDTGVAGNQNTNAEAKFVLTELTQNNNILSAYGSSSNTRDYLISTSALNYLRLGYGSELQLSEILEEVGVEYVVKTDIQENSQSLYINNTNVVNITSTQTFTSKNLSIFANNQNGTIQNYAKAKLYYLKIYDGTTLIRNFIPCYRKSDGEIGLYDTVNGVFYTNQGTGTFLKGNDVLLYEIQSVRVSALKNNGGSMTVQRLKPEIYTDTGPSRVFGENSPEKISNASAEIAAQNMTAAQVAETYGWNLGDTVDITLKNNETIQMQIIGVNHDTLSSDHTSKAGLTLQMVNCLATRYPMNSSNTNAGGWSGSVMKNTTMPTLFALLPDEWQAVIKIVDKKSANGGSSNYSATVTTSENLFLLSQKEILGVGTYAQDGENEGTQYAYWVAHNTSSDRIKYYDRAGIQTATLWWERSSSSPSTGYFRIVDTGGSSTENRASYSRGVAFAFCI